MVKPNKANPIRKLNKDDEKYFFTKVEKGQGCWKWKGYCLKDGRGRHKYQCQHVLASRISFLIYNGFINNELHVLHTCDNKNCVNPKHLYQGTDQDNSNDTVKRNRFNNRKGENHSQARLTDKQAKFIKYNEEALSRNQLAMKFNISTSIVGSIQRGSSWKHI